MTNLSRTAALTSALARVATERERQKLRNALTAHVRAILVRAIRAQKVPYDVAEDLAQDFIVKVLARLEGGHVKSGREEAYVRRVGENRARDWYRRQRAIQRVLFREDEHTSIDELACANENGNDVETALVRLEDERADEARLGAMHATLALAPARYRDMLSAVYLEQRPVESLVQEELVRRAAAAEPGAHKRARATVDKTLERARTWMRDRLASY